MQRSIPARYTVCKVTECENLVGRKGARGWCTKHYQMWRLTGDPKGTTRQSESCRFWLKVSKTENCWIWTASKDQNGYGMFKSARVMVRSHRWAYEEQFGQIPEGLVLDHLCRNTSCVNPAHLEVVTNDENLERGWGRRIKTGWVNICANGHEYTAENTYINPLGRKVCRACSAESRLRYQERKAA